MPWSDFLGSRGMGEAQGKKVASTALRHRRSRQSRSSARSSHQTRPRASACRSAISRRRRGLSRSCRTRGRTDLAQKNKRSAARGSTGRKERSRARRCPRACCPGQDRSSLVEAGRIEARRPLALLSLMSRSTYRSRRTFFAPDALADHGAHLAPRGCAETVAPPHSARLERSGLVPLRAVAQQAENGAYAPPNLQTEMPRRFALSARLSWIPVPGKCMTPIGRSSSMASLRLNGAAFACFVQSGLKPI
jgi:hypothetical protein